MSEPVIQIRDLSKRYRLGASHSNDITLVEQAAGFVKDFACRALGKQPADRNRCFWALKDINLDVNPGEVVGIIGRNGAGKSTLLKILSRITDPTSGSARITGRVGSLLEVGTGFHPELSGLENIFLNGSLLGMTKREIKANLDEIIAFSGIEKFLDTPVKRYSSGMYVRLAFAVAAHLEPEILVVDEVLAVGDAAFQERCLGKMRQVAEESGRTVLFVSHQLASVRSLCDRCVMLDGGQIAMIDTPDVVIDRYLSGMTDEASPEVDLSDRRIGPGMQRARLLVNGEATVDAKMGDELAIEVEFASPTPMPYPRLGVVIGAEDGTPLLNGNNRYQWQGDPDQPMKRGTIRCNLGAPHLMPGRYTVSLWFGDHHGDLHKAQYALSFRLAAHDLWGHGKLPPPRASHLWWPMNFDIEAEGEASSQAVGA